MCTREREGSCELREMQCDPSKDYYAVLGLSSQAQPEVVKAAHRALAKKFHPDIQPGEDGKPSQKFQEIQEAYEVLRNDDRLKQYLQLRMQLQQQLEQQKQRATSAVRPTRATVYLKLDDRWDRLVREYPELSQHYAGFCFISHKLARQFKLLVLGAQDHTRFKRIAVKLERKFYRRHFSYHRNLQKLARRLAENHRRHAVRMLQVEIKGRRFLSKRNRNELIKRYETQYLRPRTPAADIHRPQPMHAPRRRAARRPEPEYRRTTLRPSPARPIALACMGMALALGTLFVFGALFDSSRIGASQQAQVGSLARASCSLVTQWSASGAEFNKDIC